MLGAVAGAAAIVAATVAVARSPESARPRVLVFTKTAGYRHESIAAAVAAVRDLGRAHGFVVDHAESGDAFTDLNLRRYAVVVFASTTGDVLREAEQAAFERYIRRGGGFVGVHAATDTEYSWGWYGRLVGAYFKSHPEIQRAQVRVRRRGDPSTATLPRLWTRTDEWYAFRSDPRPRVRVLLTVDETTYSPGPSAMGADHPIAWAHEYDGGRAWYTAAGHTTETYREPLFRRHLLGGIRYAAGWSPPRIVAVTARRRAGRLDVSVRYRMCRPCSGRVRIGNRSVALRFRDGAGRASVAVPRGARRFTVVLRDPVSGPAVETTRRVR